MKNQRPLLALLLCATQWLEGQTSDPFALRSKQEAQERARQMARDLVSGILEVQLEQLEENGLTTLPVYRDIQSMRDNLNGILADATGQPVEKIARDVERDYILEPQQAVDYGLVDHIISSRSVQPIAK